MRVRRADQRSVRLTITSFTLLGLLAVAPNALAADVRVHEPPRKVEFTAGGGEANRLTITREAGSVRFADAVAVNPGTGCAAVTPNEATCAAPDDFRATADLGDGADEATATGPGVFKLNGEAGSDELIGHEGDDELVGGEDGDRLEGAAGLDSYDGGLGDDVISARDSVREIIVCGEGVDSVVADFEDDVSADCENVDKPLAPPTIGEPGGDPVGGPGGSGIPRGLVKPIAGKAVGLQVKQGTVLVRKPGLKNFVALDPTQPVPVGTVVDVRKGTVTMTAAKDLVGGTQTADFRGGKFAVTQKAGATNMATDLAMRGGSFKRCKPAPRRATASAAAKRKRRAVRKLFGSGHGRFRTRGRNSAATVRGTVWIVEDFCHGTRTRVKRGVVSVRNLRTGRTKLVRAGQSYFVKRVTRKRRR
jgi:Ca2+-binding RTX toxin-like protein